MAKTETTTSAKTESNVLLGRLSDPSPRARTPLEGKESPLDKGSPLSAKGRTPKSAAPTPRMKSELEALCTAVEEQLPSGPRICILGGKQFTDPNSEPLVKALAQLLAAPLAKSNAVVLTGGMPGIQATFAHELNKAGFGQIVNLLPLGEQSNYGLGEDLVAGLSLEERMGVFAQIGQIYISVEGGPGVAKEARQAQQRGAFVLPLMSTGGASGGQFGFPAAALEAPSFAAAEWPILKEGASEDVASAATRVIQTALDLEQPAAPHNESTSKVSI